MLLKRLLTDLLLHFGRHIFELVGPHVGLFLALADRVQQRPRHLADRLAQRQEVAAAELRRRFVDRRIEQVMTGHPAELRLRIDRIEWTGLFRGEQPEQILRQLPAEFKH